MVFWVDAKEHQKLKGRCDKTPRPQLHYRVYAVFSVNENAWTTGQNTNSINYSQFRSIPIKYWSSIFGRGHWVNRETQWQSIVEQKYEHFISRQKLNTLFSIRQRPGTRSHFLIPECILKHISTEMALTWELQVKTVSWNQNIKQHEDVWDWKTKKNQLTQKNLWGHCSKHSNSEQQREGCAWTYIETH